MKKATIISGMIVLMMICSGSLYGEEKQTYSKKLNFSDTSKPGILKIFRGKGDINITGYNGKEVVIEATNDVSEEVDNEKAKGLKRISGSNFSVATDADENAIIITRSMRGVSEISIKVPVNTSLKIGGSNHSSGDSFVRSRNMIDAQKKAQKEYEKTQKIIVKNEFVDMEVPIPIPFPLFGGMLGGDITVTNLIGEMDINTINSNITLNDVSGEIAVNTVDGDLLVTTKDIAKGLPMYLSSVSGEIDVTMPSDVNADVKFNNVDGDIYTDFDIDISTEVEVEEKNRKTERERMILPGMFGNIGIGNGLSGKINGGGPVIQINTVNGDIYFRQGK